MSANEIDEFVNAVNHANGGAPDVLGSSPKPLREAPEDWAKTLAVASCWAQTGNSYFPVASVVEKIPAGAYQCRATNQGPFLEKMNIVTDNLLALPDSATERLLDEFSKFWELKSEFDKRGFTFKRGMLMWGPPGSGKTSAVWQMTKRLVDSHNGVVVFVETPSLAIWALNIFRRIEPNRPIVTVTEDIDAVIRQYGEHELLALFDGENQINRVVHLATTNYPHLLDKRFIDRPSRFDTIMKVGMPSAEARRTYIQIKEPQLDEVTVERWVRRTEGYSIAHLREVCIATQCFNQSEEKVFYRLDRMRAPISISEEGEEKQRAGFLAMHIAQRE
jgi:ATP-dependent Zn protease